MTTGRINQVTTVRAAPREHGSALPVPEGTEAVQGARARPRRAPPGPRAWGPNRIGAPSLDHSCAPTEFPTAPSAPEQARTANGRARRRLGCGRRRAPAARPAVRRLPLRTSPRRLGCKCSPAARHPQTPPVARPVPKGRSGLPGRAPNPRGGRSQPRGTRRPPRPIRRAGPRAEHNWSDPRARNGRSDEKSERRAH
jgi:hypothetical protein